MPDLIHKKPGAEAETLTSPEKQRFDLRPQPPSHPAPKTHHRIQWMALFVAVATAAILISVLLIGGDTNPDPDVQAGPDVVDRYLANTAQVVPEPDVLDRYLANTAQVVPEPDVLDRYLANN